VRVTPGKGGDGKRELIFVVEETKQLNKRIFFFFFLFFVWGFDIITGCCSMRREKYIPFGGPDGGDGGKGGDIIIKADERLSSLRHLKTSYHAQSGGPGQGKAKTGKKGEHMVIPVPVGWSLSCQKKKKKPF